MLHDQKHIPGVAKRWVIRQCNEALSLSIARALNISPLISQVLINRGIDTADAAWQFLSPRLADLHSPFLMKDMGRAVDRVLAALSRRERICICGDYDVDGITATALLVLFLREAGGDVQFYMPSRVEDGYGLNRGAIEALAAHGVRLIITVDCGSGDVDEVAYATSLGIDVIVTDHHEPPERLAPAYALINPKQPACAYPFKGLAGVGVAFKLIMALRRRMREMGSWVNGEPNLKRYLDIVALGTIADVVPLIDENRVLVKNGLEVLSEGGRPGIHALKKICGIGQSPVTASLVGYRLAPRMNASGRIADASAAVRLLLAQDEHEAVELARALDEDNTRRQQIERTILAQIRTMLQGLDALPDALVLYSEHWHPGVVGLCASRLSSEFNRPAILIAVDAARKEGKGSARSVEGFDLYRALKQCSGLLSAFGGHRDAAGITVSLEQLEAFRDAFIDIVRTERAGKDLIPVLTIDAEVELACLSADILEELETLAPFGPGNPEPIFCTRSIKHYDAQVVGNGHLKLMIKHDRFFFQAIGFNMGLRGVPSDSVIRLAFVPQFTTFNGERCIQLNLRDIHYP
ncbi:MAG: single-stranded-DNA-specific exonuclease RecJ [Desulfobacterota bacterium]|nr:single-stranded-DNA-specific exonuclease RecJ [Thermodesulfobacteriota bacterium]